MKKNRIMKQNTIPRIVLTLLLTNMLILAINIQPAEATTTVENDNFRVTLNVEKTYYTMRIPGGWQPVMASGDIEVKYKGGLGNPQWVHVGVYVVDKEDKMTIVKVLYTFDENMTPGETVLRFFSWILVDPIYGPAAYLYFAGMVGWCWIRSEAPIVEGPLEQVTVINTGGMQGDGGLVMPVDRLGLLAPYIGLASTMLAATVAAAIYVKRVKHSKKKQ